MWLFFDGSRVTGPSTLVGPSRAIAVRVINDGARNPEATRRAPRLMSERLLNAMGVPQASWYVGVASARCTRPRAFRSRAALLSSASGPEALR